MNRLGLVFSVFIFIFVLMIIFASVLLLLVCHYIITKGKNLKAGRQYHGLILPEVVKK